MRVFIMWAGEQSHSVARALKDFLEFVVRGPRYFISDDIEGGRLWRMVLAGELEAASFGIACMTRDNLRSHWLHFEAGALSKAVGQAHVIPFLAGPGTTDLDGPLADFQMVTCDEAGVRKLVRLLAAVVPDSNREVIDKSFRFVWPEFSEKLESVRRTAPELPAEPLRDESALIREILERIRRMEARGEGVATMNSRAAEATISRAEERTLLLLKNDLTRVLDSLDTRADSPSIKERIATLRQSMAQPGVTVDEILELNLQAKRILQSIERQ